MRLECETEIGYRLLEYQRSGATSKKKAAFTILTLCRKPGEAKQQKPTTYLLLCTSKNPAGTKYKIHDNVERLFTKFITQGKATIQLREPKHNLIISKADISELRRFLNLINLAHHGKDLDQSAFSGPPSKVTPTKETLVVRHRKDYPSGGFPKTLKKLTIEGCHLTRLGHDMLALGNLCSLKLAGNSLKTLTPQLSSLPLRELVVSQNNIERLPPELFEGQLLNSLQYLDISNNKLTVLPDTMCCARKLTTLVVRSNRLQKLPHGLGFMPCLSVLDVTSNALNLLPASLLMGTLSSISICDNPMDGAMGGPLVSTDANTHQRPLWLLQLAAQAAAASGYGRKVKLTAEDVPRCLLELLCTATPCYSCKKFVIPAAALSVILRMDLSQMVSSCGTYARGSAADVMVPVQANICSYMCLPQ
ncbi:leucine-rich repeat protein 1-like isoform X1 [Rhipicephalus sanguineus]|uniref:leucine-rich repeat protein 1-like isoform X1 n=1 Tax=Rhipicephalus sanguineus TaxID=34632 RepID=UPI001895307E|nr:leucine-rich repeat protein 1-like isoform X1 [Rhipicephalus sanguineus]